MANSSCILISSDSDSNHETPSRSDRKQTCMQTFDKDIFDAELSSDSDFEIRKPKFLKRQSNPDSTTKQKSIAKRRKSSNHAKSAPSIKKSRKSLFLSNPDIFDAELSSDAQISDIANNNEQEYTEKSESDSSESENQKDERDISCFIVSDDEVEYHSGATIVSESIDSSSDSDLPDIEEPIREVKPKKSKTKKREKKVSPKPVTGSVTPTKQKKLLIKTEPSQDWLTRSEIKTELPKKKCNSEPKAKKRNKGRHFSDLFASYRDNGESEKSNALADIESVSKQGVSSSNMTSTASTFRRHKNSDTSSDSNSSDRSDQSDDESKAPVAPKRYGRRRVRCKTRNPAPVPGESSSTQYGKLVTSAPQCNQLPAPENRRAVHRFLEDQSLCLTSPPLHCRTAHHPLRESSPNDNENEFFFVYKFLDEQVSLFQSCNEEVTMVAQTLELVSAFTNSKTEPPIEVLKELLNILISCTDKNLSFKTYMVLNQARILHIPKDEVAFSFSDLSGCMDKIKLAGGETGATGPVLALHYMVSVLEDELTHRVINNERHLLRAAISKILSVDTKFEQIKVLIQWIGAAINFDEFESLAKTFEELQVARSDRSPKTPKVPVPKVLTVLQKLLSLALSVSRHPETDAYRIAADYVHLYPQMTNSFAKELLISSITFPYLRLLVVQRVLEDRCNAKYSSGNITKLEQIMLLYFGLDPPTDPSFTPPPTPNEEDDTDDAVCSQRFSGQSCEDLVFLLWTAVSNYLLNAKSRYHYSLVRRTVEEIQPLSQPLSEEDRQTLQNMDAHVEGLKIWLGTLTNELTPKTHRYMFNMLCLSDGQ